MSCLLCSSNDTFFLFTARNLHGRHLLNSQDVFNVMRCGTCGNIFIDNIKVDEAYYKKYYDSGYYKGSNTLPKVISGLLKLLAKLSLSRKQKMILDNVVFKKTKYKILDVGCGGGDFLLKLCSKKFEKFGVEINGDGQKNCKEKGLDVFGGELEKAMFEDKFFDVITAWHVLEHLEKPIETLTVARRILADDGILVFQVPNADGFGFKYGKQNWFHSDSPRHLWMPNRNSINFLLKKTGFRILEIKNEFYDYPLDLFWSVKKSKIRFLIYPFYFVAKAWSRETLTFICKKT